MFIIVNDSCELCAREYIHEQSDKLSGLPDDQNKSAKINRIIHAAYRASCKPVVVIGGDAFGNGRHKICTEHLYKMIDAIKEYEDKAVEVI
jgi:hypothetical protein